MLPYVTVTFGKCLWDLEFLKGEMALNQEACIQKIQFISLNFFRGMLILFES